MIMCEECKVRISKNNFWSKKHKDHTYVFVDEVEG